MGYQVAVSVGYVLIPKGTLGISSRNIKELVVRDGDCCIWLDVLALYAPGLVNYV
ncbi:MAG: hypothetical protein NTZ52_02460 [Chlamydiae bacterium]|nr:hypothetical protein [Chlamydiota bacterium]